MEIVTGSLHDVVLAPQAAANNTDADSSAIDMSGFASALFIAGITDSVKNGKAELRVEASEDKSTWKRLDIEEVSATSAANDDLNGKVLRIEVKRPLQKYLRANLLSTVANIAFGQTHALRYAARRTPPPGNDDTVDEAVVVSPGYKS